MDQTHHVYTSPASQPLSESVVYAIAEAKDVDPLDLTERLYDCIDPDALDRLFCSEQSAGTLTFRMAGCRVEVEGDRVVLVTDCSDEMTPAEVHA